MKEYKLVILTPAQRELEEIAKIHLELVGPNSARKITDQIYHTMEQLQAFPLSGPPVRDKALQKEGYRFAVSGKYLCFYRVIEKTVVVYHIVHGASNYPALFKQQKNGDPV